MAKRDKRIFRTFAQMDEHGAVVAVVQVDHTVPLPSDGEGNLYVDVTAITGQDLHTLSVSPADVASQDADRVQAALRADALR